MITVAIPMGSQPDILTLVTRARSELASTLADKLQFVVFDSGSNVDQADTWTFHQARDEADAVTQAVGLVAQGKADILLKGIVQTHTLLKELLRPDYQLRLQKVLSHVAIIHLPQLNRPLLLSDAGMNIDPDEERLAAIVENAVGVAHQIGLPKPKVALLSSAENFNPKMPSSVLAQAVAKQFETRSDAVIAGPISLDLALSPASVAHKHYGGVIQGDADVLIVPTIDVGNVLYKALMLFTDARSGGTIVGAKVPIVLTSRSDSVDSKLTALAFAIAQLKGGAS
ncbi:phosphate acyltransferase [Lacticaseibacillus paracasei]|uniref:phosphate acyltransferase n=1 Tax=Lacticaseibacillus paracasei TaxID=1597 RepID=UPI0028DDAB9E|nr:phosphate acyltransferase [Lacticaseibacillus paracasei]MDT8950272.1 phosphate acyltransferase [Lacticaseibacillus paracasei subsp. paracasei]